MGRAHSRTSRRRFLRGGLVLTGLGLLVGCGTPPFPARPAAKMHRIGFLANFPSQQSDAFRAGLAELGYVEGQSIALEERWSDGIRERFPSLAAELVTLNVDVIVASSNPAARAAKEASNTIPIVSPNLSFPVNLGLVASLAHPGGNLTGLALLGAELDAKRLELLKDAVPRTRRVAFLAESAAQSASTGLRDAAEAFGLQLNGLVARDPEELEVALRGVTVGQADALLVGIGALFLLHRGRVLAAATRIGLPAMYAFEEYVRDGGLMFYGPNQPDLFYRAAAYVDKILNGTKPADLPVEQPTTFDFVINLKTAQALGLTIPESVLQQATEVIQ